MNVGNFINVELLKFFEIVWNKGPKIIFVMIVMYFTIKVGKHLIKKFVERETAEHKKEIQDMQKRVDADEKSNQKIIGTVKVYYKIYFKDQSFPFRLILY